LNEKFDIYRVLAMMVMIGGMLLVVLGSDISSSSGADSTTGGYAIVVLSVIVFALYEIMFEIFYPGQSHEKGRCRESKNSLAELAEGNIDIHPKVGKNWETLNFVAYMGIMNILFMWFPLLILDNTGVEDFVLPKSANVVRRLLINAALGAVYTSSYLVGIAFTSPTFMSVGALLVVPVGVVTDYWLNDVLIPLLSGVGCIIIALGFIFSILRLWYLRTPDDDGSSNNVTRSQTETKPEIRLEKMFQGNVAGAAPF